MPVLQSFLEGLIAEIWKTFDSASVYILLGLLISGLIRSFISNEDIAKYLGRGRYRPVFLAAIFGVPLPLCSCGVIPAALSLRKSGASKGATLSFLISTPETGLDSIALSIALLNPLMAVFRPIAALVTAIVAGVAEALFDPHDEKSAATPSRSCCSQGPQPATAGTGLWQRLGSGLYYAFVDLLKDIAGWLLLGIVTAGAIAYFIPESMVSNYLGTGWVSMIVMLLIGIPLYICASASTPIAAALMLKGLSPGAALVFLLAGPATNPATIIMSLKFLGKRATVIYLGSIAACSLGLGFFLDALYAYWKIDPKADIGQAGHIMPHEIKTWAAYILIALIAYAFWPKRGQSHA